MLSNKQAVTDELRAIQPALTRISRVIRKNSNQLDIDMATLGKLIDLSKEQILTEYRIETELAFVMQLIDEGKHEHRQFTVESPEYIEFIKTLHNAVVNVKNIEDLVYIKSKYYPIFDAAYVADTDYKTMVLDINRLDIDTKTVKVSRNEITVVPWYKRLFQRIFKNTVISANERKVDSRGAL